MTSRRIAADERRYRRNAEAVWTVVDDRVIVALPDREQRFVLSGTGTSLWKALARPATLGELAEVIRAQYDVSERAARDDIEAFVDGLVAAGLVVAK